MLKTCRRHDHKTGRTNVPVFTDKTLEEDFPLFWQRRDEPGREDMCSSCGCPMGIDESWEKLTQHSIKFTCPPCSSHLNYIPKDYEVTMKAAVPEFKKREMAIAAVKSAMNFHLKVK